MEGFLVRLLGAAERAGRIRCAALGFREPRVPRQAVMDRRDGLGDRVRNGFLFGSHLRQD